MHPEPQYAVLRLIFMPFMLILTIIVNENEVTTLILVTMAMAYAQKTSWMREWKDIKMVICITVNPQEILALVDIVLLPMYPKHHSIHVMIPCVLNAKFKKFLYKKLRPAVLVRALNWPNILLKIYMAPHLDVLLPAVHHPIIATKLIRQVFMGHVPL